MAFRRLQCLRLASAFEATGVIHLQALAGSFLIVGVTTYAPPYADDLLASWDQAVGFSWVNFVNAFRPYPTLMAFLYDTFLWQSLLVIAFLSWKGMHGRIWTFVTAATLSLTLCTVIFMYLPAKAPYIYYGVPELAGQSAGTRFLEPVEYIRNGGRNFSLRLFSGCITFPSYHAACGLLYCWAVWPTLLRWPAVAVNMAMFVGAIVIGGHYFVDLLGGVAVAGLSLAAAGRVVERLAAATKPA
jgi:membrane-associated phospholipid phosphatase